MANTIPSGGGKRPSDRTIAFAVSIVLSKPEELTVREYIQLLRQHVAKGRRENAISSAYRHLDRSSYWRSEYERLKDALKAAEGQNLDLKQEIDGLKGKLEDSRPTVPAKKRKKPDGDVVLVPRSPKKAKQDVSLAKSNSESIADLDFSDIGEAGNILVRSVYQINAILSSNQKTEPLILAYHLVRAAAALPQAIERAVEHLNSAANSEADFLRAVLNASSRCVLTLLAGFGRIANVADGAEVQGHVTYAYVQMYAKLVGCLDVISNSELNKPATTDVISEHGKKQPPSKAKAKQPKAVNLKDNGHLNLMSNFLCHIIEHLNPKTNAHKALFEGFAYVTLTRMGDGLHVLVFGKRRGSTIEDEIALGDRPDEIGDSEEGTMVNSDEMQVKTAKLEAPYLIHLLTRIMNAAPAHLGAILMNKAAKSKQANKNVTKAALAIHAKERLQRTLVNCIFGAESAGEEDEFVDCLRMAPMSESALPMPKIKEAEVQEWFKEEMWRLLGWDILSRERDW